VNTTEELQDVAVLMREAANKILEMRSEIARMSATIKRQYDELEGLKGGKDLDVIGTYQGKDGRRYWWSGGTWLMPGEVVAVVYHLENEGVTP
jgi:hypothetical protein